MSLSMQWIDSARNSDWFNDTYLPALLSTEHNNSGADNIGTTADITRCGHRSKSTECVVDANTSYSDRATPDGAITDAKLSNEEGQIKDRVTEIQGEVESHKNDNS